MRCPITWIVINTIRGYEFFKNQLKDLQNYSIDYYSSNGFNLYARISGMSRQFAYEHFNTWTDLLFRDELGCYFIKNHPSSSIKKLTEEEFHVRLKENDEIYYKVRNSY